MNWKGEKEIVVLSTIHSTETVAITKWGIEIVKPQVVVNYNATIDGVDRVDQYSADYGIPRKRGKK